MGFFSWPATSVSPKTTAPVPMGGHGPGMPVPPRRINGRARRAAAGEVFGEGARSKLAVSGSCPGCSLGRAAPTLSWAKHPELPGGARGTPALVRRRGVDPCARSWVTFQLISRLLRASPGCLKLRASGIMGGGGTYPPGG